ncbi:MAG: hypothetical protein Q8904_04455 [Bacteroidota bacterium]|nr:hypothetical protein [Bacteroidota bacterium]
MRTNIIKSIFFFAIILLCACTSESDIPKSTKVAFPLITQDTISDVLIQGGVLKGKFSVDMYYKDYPVDSRIIVAMNGDYKSTKVFVASVKTFPSVQTITDAQLVALFGLSSINAGDYFEVGLDVKMQDGNWYPAFNSLGIAYGSGPLNLPGASPIITYSAVCVLDVNEFVGTAKLADNGFYGGTYTASIVKDDATHLRIKHFATCAGDVVLSINPKTQVITVPKQKYDVNLGALGAADYTNPVVEGKGTIDACNKKIVLTLTYTSDQAGFGTSPVTISY